VKGLFTLLDAFRLLIDAGNTPKLRLVGDGPLRPKLERRAIELGISDAVTFVGWVPRTSLTSYYRDCDVFVLPSLNEAFGKVLVEAALCSAPVVATRLGGIPEVVLDRKTGLLVPPNDAPGLAAAIARLFDDPGLARAMGEKGRQLARGRFDFEKMLDATVALWHRAAGKKQDRGE
jgi:glycosyltransferase involved in cell wall biosynthesis